MQHGKRYERFPLLLHLLSHFRVLFIHCVHPCREFPVVLLSSHAMHSLTLFIYLSILINLYNNYRDFPTQCEASAPQGLPYEV